MKTLKLLPVYNSNIKVGMIVSISAIYIYRQRRLDMHHNLSADILLLDTHACIAHNLLPHVPISMERHLGQK